MSARSKRVSVDEIRGPGKFVDHNILFAHARLEGSGRVRSGPPRPPYLFAPEDDLEGGRETRRRYARLAGMLSEAPGRTAAE
jgi:hypothetical protein